MKQDRTRRGPRLACGAAALCLTASAQDPPQPEPAPKPTIEELGVAPDDPREEMIEVFHRVERRLEEIDRLLYDAAAGEAQLSAVSESGMLDLLRRSQSKSEEAIQGIDRILEIANQNGGTCNSAMAGRSSPQSQPKDAPQQGGKQPSPREATPEMPGGEQPQPEPSEGDGQTPTSPRESTQEPQNRAGAPPPPIDTARSGGTQTNERWGDLPEHLQDLFRTEGSGDMPPRYRDSIDAYYRRLNERP
jgi:hypothetical protein